MLLCYTVTEKTEWRCKSQSKKLRQAIEKGTRTYERWIHVHLPSVDEHTNHPTGDVSVLNFYLFKVFYYNLHAGGVLHVIVNSLFLIRKYLANIVLFYSLFFGRPAVSISESMEGW